MRKGRSSRRSRSSRPLIGSKAPPASVEALATEIGAANAKTPRVVVGISPSEPPPPETAESLIPPSVEAKGVVDVVTPAESSAERAAPLDPVAALETLEKTSVPPPPSPEEPVATPEEKREALASTMMLGSAKAPDAPASEAEGVEAKDDEQQEQGEQKAKPDLASTLAFGSSANVDDAEGASTKGSLASTLAMGSPLAEVAAPENVETPEKTDTPEQTEPIATRPAEPVKVIEDPLPSPKPVAAEPVMPEKVEKAKTEEAKGRDVTSGGKKNKKKGAAKGEAAKAAAADPDDVSVPPIGDIGVDERFFSEGDVSHHVSDAIEGDALTVLDKAKRKSEPHVVERRARFVRYVKWAVAGAALVCVAAIARTTMSSKAPVSVPATAARGAAVVATAEAPPASPKAAASAAAPMAEPVAAPPSTTTVTAAEPANTNAITAEPANAPAVTAEPVNAPAATAEPANANANAVAAEPANANAPVVAAEPANGPAANAEPANADATPETKPDVAAGDAKEAKAKARSSLEKRKIADAIEAGERSVKLDPTDGEAWLILGAAYQEKGNIAEARRAYSSCVKEGKTGPRTECAKMLR